MASKKKRKITGKRAVVQPIEQKKREWAFNNKLNWIIALLVLLPFVYSRKSMEPALSPRFLFESGFLAIYHLYFFGIRGDKYFVRLPKLAMPTLILTVGFGLWSLVAVYSSTNLGESIYEVSRNFLNILLLFTVIHAFNNSKFNALVFCRWIAMAALVHSFIGFDENFAWGYTKFPGGASPHGLFANRNLFGSIQALTFPFTIYLIYKEKGIWKLFAAFCTICIISSIYVAITRAAYISATVVFLVGLVAPFFVNTKLSRRSVSFGIISVSALLIIFGLREYNKLLSPPKRKSSTVELSQKVVGKPGSISSDENDEKGVSDEQTGPNYENIGFLTRLANSSESIKERLVVWQESVGVIKDNPLLGVGPGNWKVDIPKYRIGGIRNDYGKIVRIRPHNIYVQIVTENGFPGAFLYFGVWVLVFIMAIMVLRQSKDLDQKLITIMLIAGFFSFAIDGFFSFPLERYEHTAFLFVMTGMVISSYISLFEHTEDSKRSNWSRLLLIPIVAYLSWNIFLGMQRHKFEYHMNRAKVFQKRKQNEKIIVEVEAGKSKWVSLDPNKDPLEIQSAMALKNLKKYDEALVEAKQALAYSPHSTRNLNTLGTIYTETKQYDKAIETYKKALFYAPYYEVTLKNLALNYVYSKDYKSCLETLEKIQFRGDEMFEKVHRVATYHVNKEKEDAAKKSKK